MYLKRLEISGFKSFAKRTGLDFSTPITAIVGPNGSGKSNVAEAFRFVLGEQSLKSMRGKKGEDLIWNGGSGAISKLNRASVKIVFDNRNRILDLDFDEVALERVVYRDSLSEYLINGSQVRLKDIIELLVNAHIGASGHHIISQGEADHILVASSKERREMIEDALGLKIYQYKKRESERKLEKTEENIKSVESLRREISPHLKFLGKQVEKLEKAKEMREELKNLYREYLRREHLLIQELKKQAETNIKEPEERLKKIEHSLIEAKKTIESNPAIDSKRQEILKIENDLRQVRTEKDELFRQSGRLEGEISSLKRLIQKEEKEKMSVEEVRISLREIKDFRLNLERELEAISTFEPLDKNLVVRFLENFRQIIKSFFEKFDLKNSTENENNLSNSFSGELFILDKNRLDLETKIKEITDRENNLYSRYESLKREIEAEKDKNQEAERNIFKLMADQKEAYADLNLARSESTRVNSLTEGLNREIEEGGFLLGREILYFHEDESARDLDGNLITLEMVIKEERQNQEDRLRKINKLKIRIEDSGISGGEEIIKEFNDTKERDEFLNKELEDLKHSSESLVNLIKDLEEKIETEFKNGIEKINKQFQDFFAMMFDGGKALIKLVEQEKKKKRISIADLEGEELPEDILDDEEEKTEIGIEIDIRLPRKNIRGLEMLSGGERALTSIALLFAISQVNPPPFIILDETDAALDESNSRKYGDMIENLAKLSQLILITHNRETMSRAGVLYGVTMGSEGVSNLLSINFEEASTVAK